MYYKYIFGLLFKGCSPGKKAVSVCMAADTIQSLNMRLHIDLFTKDLYSRGTILKQTA